MKKILIIIIILFINNPLSWAQDCKRYHAKHCKFAVNNQFKYSGQSRSASFVKGQVSSFSIVAYGGRDYSFSVCGHRKLGDIQFRLLEADSKKVLYDNADDNYATMKIFTIETTTKLLIEISVEGTEDDTKQIEEDKLDDEFKKLCVGVLIEYIQTPDAGF